jgi:putative ABC transport system substrate-binding protein
VIGFLRSTAAAGSEHLVTAFRRGLNEMGFVEGQNVAIEYRWAEDRRDRLPGLAADLVRGNVTAIVGNSVAAQTAKNVTTTIPLVFVVGTDPVSLGLVSSFSRPGGNVTGVSFTTTELAGKRLGLLYEMNPKTRIIAALVDPRYAGAAEELRAIEEARRDLDMRVVVIETLSDLDATFSTIVSSGARALLVGNGAFFLGHRREIVERANRHALPATFVDREYAALAGLMSYGPSQTEAYRRAGNYVGRILKGEKPADLPVERSSLFELVINLRTANAFGITIPPTLLARADEVIE